MKNDNIVITTSSEGELIKSEPAPLPQKDKVPSNLWVDKYHPENSSDLIGNPGAIKELTQWLKNWSSNEKSKDHQKGCVITGPPGIGKTSATTLIAKECGYRPIHLNASDQRSRNTLQNSISVVLNNRGFGEYLNPGGNSTNKPVLIMDEIDGMSTGDYGGLEEISNMIKTTKVPIICLCNDKYKVKNLTGSKKILHLSFRRPTVAQMYNRISKIASSEGIQVSGDTLKRVIGSTNGDIRQILNSLQIVSLGHKKLQDKNVSNFLDISSKDFELGPFDVAPKLFNYSNSSTEKSKLFNEKLQYFFVDYSMMPLFVQENYLKIKPIGTKKGFKDKELSDLCKMSEAANSISEGDLISSNIYTNQSFELLPAFGAISSVRPCFLMDGTFGSRLEFPRYMGKISTFNKQKRLLAESKYASLRREVHEAVPVKKTKRGAKKGTTAKTTSRKKK